MPRRKILHDHPLIVAAVIVLLVSITGPASMGAGAVVAAWLCECMDAKIPSLQE